MKKMSNYQSSNFNISFGPYFLYLINNYMGWDRTTMFSIFFQTRWIHRALRKFLKDKLLYT